MTRRTTLTGAGMAALAAFAVATAPASAAAQKDNGNRIRIVGGQEFRAGHHVADTQRFVGTTSVRPGQTVRVVNRATAPDPHTISFVKKADLPKSFADMGKPALLALGQAHGFPEGGGPDGPPPAPANPIVDVGAAGFDRVGDSWYFTGKRYSFKVASSAKKGTYSYFCVVHPWMQGTLKVK